MCSYDADHTAGLPDPALLASLGCGNPTAVAELREGEVVLDLGSGGGIDALLSARRVGSAGKAYGLDMTEEMLALARDNAAKAGATNIEFLRGQIEDIPLPANSVDVIISNCIVNLSPDKLAVLRETHRVLVPGARIGISDSAMSPSWATPTNSPSASCTRGDNGRSLLVTACAADTFPFTAVPPSISADRPEGSHWERTEQEDRRLQVLQATGQPRGVGSTSMQEPMTAFVFLKLEDPLVAWLVYRGEMVSAPRIHPEAMSLWMAGHLRSAVEDGWGGARYREEVALEEIRQARFPDAVSRLTGFYVFPDEETATKAAARWNVRHLRSEFLAEVGLIPGSRTSRHDAEWITHRLGRSDDEEWMAAYLGGLPYGDDPIWELLVDGRAFVYGTELREAAYLTVKEEWPRSLAALELARLGVELGSDLGLITAMAIRQGDTLAVRYVMNFADADDAEWLARLKEFPGPRNQQDLRPDSELVIPDLREREFSVVE